MVFDRDSSALWRLRQGNLGFHSFKSPEVQSVLIKRIAKVAPLVVRETFKLKPQKLLEQFCVDSCRATKTFLSDLLVLRCSCAHQLLERSKLSRDVPARLLP